MKLSICKIALKEPKESLLHLSPDIKVEPAPGLENWTWYDREHCGVFSLDFVDGLVADIFGAFLETDSVTLDSKTQEKEVLYYLGQPEAVVMGMLRFSVSGSTIVISIGESRTRYTLSDDNLKERWRVRICEQTE